MNHAKFCLSAQGWSTPKLNDSDVLLRDGLNGEIAVAVDCSLCAMPLRATFTTPLNRLTTVRGNRCRPAASR
jgi:hypothetical protein